MTDPKALFAEIELPTYDQLLDKLKTRTHNISTPDADSGRTGDVDQPLRLATDYKKAVDSLTKYMSGDQPESYRSHGNLFSDNKRVVDALIAAGEDKKVVAFNTAMSRIGGVRQKAEGIPISELFPDSKLEFPTLASVIGGLKEASKGYPNQTIEGIVKLGQDYSRACSELIAYTQDKRNESYRINSYQSDVNTVASTLVAAGQEKEAETLLGTMKFLEDARQGKSIGDGTKQIQGDKTATILAERNGQQPKRISG